MQSCKIERLQHCSTDSFEIVQEFNLEAMHTCSTSGMKHSKLEEMHTIKNAGLTF
jgi:hypothetical protein